MFGALVVRAPDGRIGYLRAFSGMLGGAWLVDGFRGHPRSSSRRATRVPGPAGEAELGELAATRSRARGRSRARRACRALRARHADELAGLRARHLERRAARRATRARGGDPPRARTAQSAAIPRSAGGSSLRTPRSSRRSRLASTSSKPSAWPWRLVEPTAHARAARGDPCDLRDRERARGERRALRDLFDAPPGGAGDCTAPKLLAHAYRLGLVPIALAEIWVEIVDRSARWRVLSGVPRQVRPDPRAQSLGGTTAEPPPLFGADAIDAGEPRVLFEDAWLAVVGKPVGLLSVPGRSGALPRFGRDAARAARFGDAHIVHRLDLDTSGVLLVAKHPAIHAALQRDFARRAIGKRYVAVLDGAPADDAGAIELALRVDLDDRPRQVVDPVHGKAARTEWRVVSRTSACTRVELVPRTGRTHQLRVHCAVGLGAPIVGDRLYGRPGERLLLHAEALAFEHPHTGERVAIEWPAPF